MCGMGRSVEDEPQGGRWRIYVPQDKGYDLNHWGPVTDVEAIERSIGKWVRGGEGNPFELFMAH